MSQRRPILLALSVLTALVLMACTPIQPVEAPPAAEARPTPARQGFGSAPTEQLQALIPQECFDEQGILYDECVDLVTPECLDADNNILLECIATTPAADEPDSAASAPAGEENLVADTGFRPTANGFSFPNYGDDFAAVNLTSDEMWRMFGDAVCARIAGGQCTLTSTAAQWMEQTNGGMSGGHCEGFAVLSQLIYGGLIDPTQFGGNTASELALEENEPLQREIAYWFTTQFPTWSQQRVGSANEQVEFLLNAYQENPSDLYRIGVTKADGSGGHAITAYGIEDIGGGIYWILVYDNNYPDETRRIEVHTNTNTWQYEASINPEVEPDLYTGDESNPIFLAANEPRLGIQPCDFCAGDFFSQGDGLSATGQRYNQVWLEGDAQPLIVDEEGRRLGYDAGEFVNEIPGAKVQRVLGDNSLAQQDVPPIFHIPVGITFTVTIDGNSIKDQTENNSSVVMIGQGYYVGVDGIVMDPDQVDHLTLGGEGGLIAYRTDYSESPDIILGIQKPEADFELNLHGEDIKPDTETLVLFDHQADLIAVSSTSDEYGEFSLSITRIDDEGEESFESEEPLRLEPGDTLYFYFGEWKGEGSNLEIGLDAGGDGTIDDVVNMSDQE